MSDDELTYVKKTHIIHYGSLEDSEKARISDSDAKADTNENGSSQVHVSNGSKLFFSIGFLVTRIFLSEYMELEDAITKDKQALLEEFERRKKARSINVSTDDSEVKKNLRQLGEPICLFGEGPAERRSRLRDILSWYVL